MKTLRVYRKRFYVDRNRGSQGKNRSEDKEYLLKSKSRCVVGTWS